ncbi:hypothetical protein ONE63_001806 [Megalurothrips usitatus]|uniref:Transmembrane protein 151B-like n=1 Tax=Megalurothrips usitatus TaxID=439358 RepID=A0AAV7XAJ6_9NEOP|nr:hypothetical protein ONE63_001806 [Megalurothrips usitatus]
MLTLLIMACCGAVTWCRLTEVTRVMLPRQRMSGSGTPCEAGYLYIPVCFLALLYLVYLAECWHSRAQLSLQGHAQTLAEVLCFVQQMRSAEPVVWWKAVCYHYVRRKRQVTRYRHGEGYTATQVYYERVNSHAAASEFQAAACGVRDISKELVLDPPAPVTRIRFSKGFAFSNVEAAADFEEQRARFFSDHERFDDYMEMREGLDLGVAGGAGGAAPSFRELVVAYRDRKPWYYRPAVFWSASLLLMSWPVRLLQEYNTAHVHYQVTKLFGINYDAGVGPGPPTGDWLSGRLSHGSTLDSIEWDSCIRENCALIPSYSEALLMDEDDGGGGVVVGADEEEREADEHRSLVSTPAAAPPRDSVDELLGHPAVSLRSTVLQGRVKRRSWGCLLRSVASMGSVGTAASLGSLGSVMATAVAVDDPEPEPQLYYPSPLAERSPGDPFQGRSTEIPTRGHQQPPPPYEEALETTVRLVCEAAAEATADAPLLTRLRRSLTDRGEAFRAGRASWAAAATPSWGVLGDVAEAVPAEANTPRRCSETHVQSRSNGPCINMETSL